MLCPDASRFLPFSTLPFPSHQYAEIVVDMNRARRHGSRLTYPAVTRFAKHARALAQRHAHANEASKLLWPLLERMFGAREEREATEGAHAAFGAPSRDPAAVAAVTARGRAHLEDSFRLAAERRGTGSEAGAGALGVARAFVQALFASRPAVRRACASSPRERASGASAWAVAYLTLRMGGVGAAARIVREVCAADLDAAADVVTCVNRLERMLGAGRADTPAAGAAAAAAAADSRSEAAACARLSVAADTHAVARGDPFRSLLLALLSGRTAPKRARALVCESVQDFMWLQLAHVAAPAPRDGAEAEGVPGTPASSGGSGGAQSAGKRAPASIGQLAARVLRYGAGHFDPRGDRPADYAQVLLLCLEPERAASHLAAHGRLPDAVHMALALQHSGALLTATALAEHGLLEGAVPVAGSPFLGEIRMSRGGSARPRAALNVTEMLRAQSLYLTRSRPQLAAHYARHVPDPGRRAALLAEVLLISGAYDQMLGPAAAQRVGGGPSTGPESEERGELARLVLPDSHVARVVALAAEGAVAQGDTLAAVKLRVRAGQWTEALQLLATELSRVASGGGGERRRVWLDVARDVRALSVEQAMGARFGETSAHGGSVAHLLSVVDGMLALADLADNVHAADGSAASVAALDSAVQRAEAVVPLRAPEQAQAAHVQARHAVRGMQGSRPHPFAPTHLPPLSLSLRQVAAFSALPPPLRELANESLPLYVGALQRLLEARVREVSGASRAVGVASPAPRPRGPLTRCPPLPVVDAGVTVDAESLVRQAELAVALSGAPEVHGIAEHTRTTLIQMYEAMRRLA